MKKKTKPPLYRKSKRMVPTSEDWYPNYENNMVEGKVSLQEHQKGVFLVLVCFWGSDDFGIELWKEFRDDKLAFQYYHSQVKWLTHLTVANHTELKKVFGFKQA